MKTDAFVTKSSEETQKLAEQIGENLKGGEILALFGNLGAGKTTFVQGLAKGLGIKERIISPTFVLIRQHKTRDLVFYHIDLYRLQNLTELKELELEEILNNKDRIVVIEWAEKIRDLLPEKRIDIHFEYIDENKRKITIKKYG